MTASTKGTAEYILGPHDVIRAEILDRNGKRVVSIARLKRSATGDKRTGQVFEIGAHRTAGMVTLWQRVQTLVDGDT